MLRKPKCRIAKLLPILVAFALPGCSSGWTGPREEPGPLPLSSPRAPITRLIKTRETFEHTYKKVLWDEGNGPVPMEERVEPVVNAVPKELLDRLRLTRNVPRPNGNGRYDERLYDAHGVVVSVNPDVLIVTVRDVPQGKGGNQFAHWFRGEARWQYIYQRLELVRGWDSEIPTHAGSLIPWSDEMYVISTDPKVHYRRLKFENNQATVLLPAGKLVLCHHDDDVDVSRE